MRRIGFIKLSVGSLLSVLFLISCYPDGGLNSISDYDVVVTRYNSNYNFGAVATYALIDSVYHVIPDTTLEDKITREHDQLMLDKVADNMNKIGYQRITNIDTTNPGTKPDVVIIVGVTATNHQGYTYYPGYWGGWGAWPGWGYWPPYGPGYGPWYPGVAVPYSFTTGTILVGMVEPDEIDKDRELIPIEWEAGLNGLLGSSTSDTAARIGEGIDQAFNQSPYLGRK